MFTDKLSRKENIFNCQLPLVATLTCLGSCSLGFSVIGPYPCIWEFWLPFIPKLICGLNLCARPLPLLALFPASGVGHGSASVLRALLIHVWTEIWGLDTPALLKEQQKETFVLPSLALRSLALR